MGSYREINGDLIKQAEQGNYDVIAHGCNCFCTMGAGIAPQFAKAFTADRFPLEAPQFMGAVNKLGMIDYKIIKVAGREVAIVNAYTQYGTGSKKGKIPLDYDALTLCLRKMNVTFRGKVIGLPQIGCGLGGGDWSKVKQIISDEMGDCDVRVVIYKK